MSTTSYSSRRLKSLHEREANATAVDRILAAVRQGGVVLDIQIDVVPHDADLREQLEEFDR